MSQDYQHHHHHHQGIFNFPNGFDRPQDQEQQHHHVAQQIRRDKLRVPGFEPQSPLVPMEEDVSAGGIPVYEAPGNMLSEMFNFPPTELLQNQIPQNYDRNSRQPAAVGGGSEWYGSRLGMGMGPPMGESVDPRHLNPHHHHNHISSINGESSSSAAAAAAVMQLFLMNPQQQQQQQPRSPPSPSQPHETSSSSTLHMLLPNPSIPSSNSSLQLQGFHNSQISPGSVSQAGGGFGQFTWLPDTSASTGHGGGGTHIPGEIGGGLVEGQGLSLSLSSSLQQLGAAKAEEFRMGDGGGGAMLFFNQGGGGAGAGAGAAASNYSYKNFAGGNQQIHVGYGASLGVVNVLRNSKYVKAAQELLEEFCSVGRGQFKKNKLGRQNSISNPNPNSGGGSGGSGGGSSTSKDIPSLSAADKIEHQRRKVKLLTMIDEASGQKIQPLLRTNANGGKLIRLGNGFRIGYSLHGLSPKGDVEALPVSQGCDSGPIEAQLRVVGRQRRGDFWGDERRDAEAKAAGAKLEAAKSVSPDGDDRARGLEAPKRVART
ncbi:hypothetical protein RHMOL_Rhmol08G0130200 [Rhododendron molle]|uniref:Uncharacterized protein n=1 Tax=Rhododendron molle TaxID=49168 RepID=A0ACC0MMU8_RHOML|nr:hypothetical protein RHMOL_Rhmol08G0130200 [Rhododendron molle]